MVLYNFVLRIILLGPTGPGKYILACEQYIGSQNSSNFPHGLESDCVLALYSFQIN